MQNMFFLAAFVCLLFCTCKNDLSAPENILEAETPSINFDTAVEQRSIEEGLFTLWEYALDSFGLEILCSCDCDAMDAVKETWVNNPSVTEPFGTYYWQTWTCEEMQEVLSFDCIYTTLDSQLSFLNQVLYEDDEIPVEAISDQERLFIWNFILDASDSSGIQNYEIYWDAWEQLEAPQGNNKELSFVLLSTASSVQAFMESSIAFPYLGEPEPEAIFSHIGGAIVGALVGIYVEAQIGAITGEGIPNEEEFWKDVRNDAIGGAILAI